MNIERTTKYAIKIIVRAIVIMIVLFGLSLLAVSLWFLNYNAPIIPLCPIAEGSNQVIASDMDGTVVSAGIRNIGRPEVQLIEITPASGLGGNLTAQLQVLDTIPKGKHRLELTFANNDAPIPQTANCKILVNVRKDNSSGQTRTYYTISTRGRVATAPNLINSLTNRVFLGLIPGLLAIALTVWGGARFVQGFYGLEKSNIGFRFMQFQLLGQPNPKKPKAFAINGVLQSTDEQITKIGGPATVFLRIDTFSAIILEKAGQLTRIARAPVNNESKRETFCWIEPFEKVWDTLDLRPQRWATETSAITRDGIPIKYAIDAQFRIKDADDAVLKAATSKWIRDTANTEPERLMIWTKRLVIGALGGTLRGILARYELSDLLNVEVRQEIYDNYRGLIEKSANNLGLDLLGLTLGDITFDGQVLLQWFQEWQAERNRRIAPIQAQFEIELQKAREVMLNSLRQHTLKQTLENLKTLTENQPEEVYRDYILLSFVEVVRNLKEDKSTTLTMDELQTTIKELNETIRPELPKG